MKYQLKVIWPRPYAVSNFASIYRETDRGMEAWCGGTAYDDINKVHDNLPKRRDRDYYYVVEECP